MRENEKGVFIDVHTDKNGKDHIDIYDKNTQTETINDIIKFNIGERNCKHRSIF